ncbi:hypothetical protein C3E93_28630, partial [Klebsiella pneumoniae]
AGADQPCSAVSGWRWVIIFGALFSLAIRVYPQNVLDAGADQPCSAVSGWRWVIIFGALFSLAIRVYPQ